MQTLVKTARGPGHLELRDAPVPQIALDEVLIRVRACGICGSDLKNPGRPASVYRRWWSAMNSREDRRWAQA
jgi:NADPH:quinone reductase-like Zn-dependent oxidoreductase